MRFAAVRAVSMPVGQRRKVDTWFVTGMACFLLLACPAFMVLAPWTTAITVAEATERYPGQVDPTWHAVVVEHGRPHEWDLGTRGQNPLGFAACTAALALGAGGFAYCAYRSWRLQRDGVRRASRRT
jgi:hypothetical protein